MRVLIVGGYGVFGSLIAELLLRDEHEVWIAGRNRAKAEAAAARLGGRALVVDISRDPAPVLDAAPEIVVDAAGPFQDYGPQPYRLARLCIENGIDYLDISDDAGFTAGIAALDAEARQAGRRVLSGASSVPGLSSSAVRALAAGLDEISLIETAILPGNRAPRGRSVMASILGQVGRSFCIWRGKAWREATGWSGRRDYLLDSGDRRPAYLIAVPDTVLFPRFFSARSVIFRAGLELWALNAALRFFAVLKRGKLLPARARFVTPARWIAKRLTGLGSDRGAMFVEVTGRKDDAPVRRRWRLLAEAGEGPYVPCVTIRALLRRMERIPSGARPCLAEAPLEEIEAAISDLAIRTSREEEPRPTLFQTALGNAWQTLDPAIRTLHSVQDLGSFSGRASVQRGKGAMAGLAAWLFRFPKAGDDVPVTVTMTRKGAGEIWERKFAGRIFRSSCTPAPGPARYRERFGPFVYDLDLLVEDGAIHFPVRRGWFLGIPIPAPFLARSESREYTADGLFHFDIALSAPLGGGLIVRYRGFLRPDRESPEPRLAPAGENCASGASSHG